jgi:hypothetical protein
MGHSFSDGTLDAIASPDMGDVSSQDDKKKPTGR